MSKRDAIKERLKASLSSSRRESEIPIVEEENNGPLNNSDIEETEIDAQKLIEALKNKRKRNKKILESKTEHDEVVSSDLLAAIQQDMRHKRFSERDPIVDSNQMSTTVDLESKNLKKSSLNESIKSKLSKTLKEAKDEGKDKVYKGHKFDGKRSIRQQTRFDETLEELEEEDVDELEKAITTKLKFQALAKKALESSDMVQLTEQDKYDFFFKIFDSDKIESPKPTKELQQSVKQNDQSNLKKKKENLNESGNEIEEKEGDEDLLLEKKDDEETWLLYFLSAPDYITPEERIKMEEGYYYVPTMLEAPVTKRRVDNDDAIWNLAEQGIYTGNKPVVAPRNMHRMENRIIEEMKLPKDKEEAVQEEQLYNQKILKWFDKEGRLIVQPDPTCDMPLRPFYLNYAQRSLLTPYIKPYIENRSQIKLDQHFQLDVDVNTIVFEHHHMFSAEHVVATQLDAVYKRYISKQQGKYIDFLIGKIQDFVLLKAHLMKSLSNEPEEKSDLEKDQLKKLMEIKKDLKYTREQMNKEMEEDRHLQRRIINLWKELKRTRERQQCTNTNLKLVVLKQPVNKKEDEKNWNRDLNEEVDEAVEEAEDQYCADNAIYQTQINKWKQDRLNHKAASKREKLRRKNQRLDLEDTEELKNQDLKILNETIMEKPAKPEKKTREELYEKILEKFKKIRRMPGEAPIFLDLTNSADITQLSDCPKDEQRRRNDISKYRLFVRVFFNNKEVSKSSIKNLREDFVVRINQIFHIQIKNYPESILFEIYELSPMGITLLSSLYAPVPEPNVTTPNKILINHEFGSDQYYIHHHSGIGSGVPFPSGHDGEKNIVSNLLTSGILSASVSWSVNDDGTIMVPPTIESKKPIYRGSMGHDAIGAIGLAGLDDMKRLAQWVEETKPDPNDVSNAEIMHIMRPIVGMDLNSPIFCLPTHFRLEHIQEEFNCVRDEDISSSKRFKLIQLREQQVPGFKNIKIPSQEWEVSNEMIAMYEKKLKGEELMKLADDADSHRIAVTKFMQKVREQIMSKFKAAANKRTYSDVIDEDTVPNIGFLFPALSKLTEPRRPLRPTRKPRKKIALQSLQTTEVYLIVNVIRIIGAPLRMLPDTIPQSNMNTVMMGTGNFAGTSNTLNQTGNALNNDMILTERLNRTQAKFKEAESEFDVDQQFDWDRCTTGQNYLEYQRELLSKDRLRIISIWSGQDQNPNYCANIEFKKLEETAFIGQKIQVRPFVEVIFQQRLKATSVACGPNPSFNEEISILFKPPNDDFSPTNLQTINDNIYLNLFDEYIIEDPYETINKSTYKRIERRWLGNLTIPFNTIYMNGRIEGTFRIKRPPVLLGYKTGKIGNEMDFSYSQHTYVTLFITMEPQLSAPEPYADKILIYSDQSKRLFDSFETDELLNHCDQWISELEIKYPQRFFVTTVINLEGQSVLTTRFIRSLKPPEQIIIDKNVYASMTNMESVARYVSLIPSVSDSVLLPGLCDIWSTSLQFLQMLQGDEEEHAMLLANFFLNMEIEAWLVTGTAIPEGNTAYVLTKHNGEWLLWQADTGEHFSIQDNYCPLKSIGCLINSKNIWANIQMYDKPIQLDFNLENKSSWKPLFNLSFPNPGLASVQPECLVYRPVNGESVMLLQERIETQLRKSISEWRTKNVTRWNRYCIQAFRKFLKELEEKQGKMQADQTSELEQIIGGYKICGFPLNLPYTDMKSIRDTVFSTGVHEIQHADVEFAAAAYVHGYPSSVLSVWIYVASLVKKRF